MLALQDNVVELLLVGKLSAEAALTRLEGEAETPEVAEARGCFIVRMSVDV